MTEPTTPLVSVIIPCYNGKDFVGDAIRSALAQTHPAVEVVVADDGSTDGSLEVIRSFGDRVRCLSLPHQGGGAARNAGLEASRGEMIQFLDADDLLEPNKLQRQLAVMQQTSADVVFCDSTRIAFANSEPVDWFAPPYHGEDPVAFILQHPLPTILALHRRKNLLAIGGWRTDLPCAQEFDLHLRLACWGCTFHHLPEVLCTGRCLPDSVSSNYVRVLDQFSRILEPAYQGLMTSGRLTDPRARSFAAAMARAARHYLRHGETEKAAAYFRQARTMHRDGGIPQVYSRPARLLRCAVGPVLTERLVNLRRRHNPNPGHPLQLRTVRGPSGENPPVKALLILHGFPPSHHSGTLRNEAVARYLPDFGINPVILCASDDDRVIPYGVLKEWHDNSKWAEVRRMEWSLMSKHACHPIRRWLQRLPLGGTWISRSARARVLRRVLPVARELVRHHAAQVIYASAPPVETLLVAEALARETNLPLVCDLRDPWTCYSWAKFRHWMDFALERRLERRVLSRAVTVIANTPTARDLLITRIGIPPGKIAVIPNGYDELNFQKITAPGNERTAKFTVVYTGIFSSFHMRAGSPRHSFKRILGMDYRPIDSDPNTRSPRWFLEAVELLLDTQPAWREKIEILFAGAFTDFDKALFNSFRYPACLRVMPALPHAEALQLCMKADLCLLLQIEMKSKGKDYCTSVPGKLYDYLRAGTRILAPLQQGDAQELVERLGAGVVVPPRDVHAIRAALEQEFRRWENGEPSRRTAPRPELAGYERRNLVRHLAEVLRVAVARSAP